MPNFELVFFESVEQILELSQNLPEGVEIITFDHGGQLAMFKANVDNIIASLNPETHAQTINTLQALNNNLVTIPEIEESVAALGATVMGMGIALSPIDSWSFVLEGSSGPTETFLTQATKQAIPSNLTPAILPAPLAIVAMTWISEIDGANEDIKLYLDGSPILIWELVNARWGVTVAQDDENPLAALPERGLLSASITNTGSPSAKDGILTIYFRLVGETTPGEFTSPTL